jgi:hypothetical protein
MPTEQILKKSVLVLYGLAGHAYTAAAPLNFLVFSGIFVFSLLGFSGVEESEGWSYAFAFDCEVP